jgi:hypothetical protein
MLYSGSYKNRCSIFVDNKYPFIHLFIFLKYFMADNCNKKICETLYTLLFADFFIHVARGKLMKFLPAIVPIPERIHPGSSSIVHSSYRHSEDFGRDLPAICRPREGFFYNFDFETVLPVSKTTAGRNFPVLLRFVLCPSRYSVFCSRKTLIQSRSILSC